jgi:tRNA pseudouridine38-40 synthase
MRKLKITIEYDGTRYQGWQSQPNVPTIQENFEQTLEKITKQSTRVYGAGRTDSGVHARGQVAHFFTESRMTLREFLKALNSCLPPDIVVTRVEEAEEGFHAQKSAVCKQYKYTIINRDFPSGLDYRFAHYVATPLNIDAMRTAAQYLVGQHDFTSFRGRNCGAKTSVRTIHHCLITKDEDYIRIEIKGNGFLKYMVRIIVGTLIDVGRGWTPANRVKDILESRNRDNAGKTAPARGLCMEWVAYNVE